MIIKASTRKGKRFMATFNNGKTIHFGQKGSQTFIDNFDKIKRENYIKRHAVNEDFSNAYSASALSRWLLWGDYKTLDENHQAFMKKFRVS
jgi:hypothetical protein